MPGKKNLSILDVTIRDGSYAIDYQYTSEQISKIAAALDAAGISLMEVGHGCGLGAGKKMGLPSATEDTEQVRAARGASKKIKIGVIAWPRTITTKEDIDSIIGEVDFIRFAGTSADLKAVESNIDYVRTRRPDLDIFLQLIRSTRISKSEIVRAGRQAEAMGVSTVYVVDTAGHFVPNEVGDIVSALTDKLKIGVGFHGHNNLGLAIANTLSAIEAGAVSVDASLKGLGRAGGNAQLEALVSLIKRMGYAKEVNLDILLLAGELLIGPIAPATAGISMTDVLTADANIDLYPVKFYEKIADEAGIEFEDFVRALGRDKEVVEAGMNEITRALKKFGVDANAVMEKVTALSSKHRR